MATRPRGLKITISSILDRGRSILVRYTVTFPQFLLISEDTDSSEKGVDNVRLVEVECAHLSDAVVTAGLHAALFTCGTSGPLNFI